MNKEEFNINQELEQMRQDYADLKDRFDKQQIVNDYLIQKAMNSDVRRLFLSKRTVPLGIAVLVVAVVLSFVQGYEWWLPVCLIIYALLFFPGVFWVYKGVREEEMYNGDVLSTTETLRKFKKRYIVLVTGSCLYFFVFVVLATIYMISLNISTELMWRRGIFIAILCVATLTLEYVYAKRLLKSCDDIIDRLQIKE